MAKLQVRRRWLTCCYVSWMDVHRIMGRTTYNPDYVSADIVAVIGEMGRIGYAIIVVPDSLRIQAYIVRLQSVRHPPCF